MFEAVRIVEHIKKLTTNAANIPGSLVTDSEHLLKSNVYSAEEVAAFIVNTSIGMNYISRNDLTRRGEILISGFDDADDYDHFSDKDG